MRNTFLLLFVLAAQAGCQPGIDVSGPEREVARTTEMPVVNLPVALRQRNWSQVYRNGGRNGSCTHAVMVMEFRWNRLFEQADWWRRTHIGGSTPNSLAADLDHAGVRYAMTYDESDVAFLEWACSTRRGAGVTVMGGEHMVWVVHFDDSLAAYVDPNSPEEVTWVPRQKFLSEWRHSYSWGVTIVYSPMPPIPVQ